MSGNKTVELSKQFISAYLSQIRHKASVLDKRDWGLFPFYWYRYSKITIHTSMWNDLAISIDRFVKDNEDKTTVKETEDRIEESHFPNLDYTQWPMFQVNQGNHDIILQGGTFNVGKHPFIKIQDGAEVRILEVRIEADAIGYPRERMFIWFLTYPNEKYLRIDKATSNAEYDFWGHLQLLATRKLDDLLSRKVGEKTLLLFRSSVERLREECIRLFSREDLDEASLQYFLEEHYFLLSPKRVEKMKRKVGSFIPDFILNHGDNTFTLVEIQLNRDPIIQNGQLSSGMKGAVGQLKNWFEWISSNESQTLAKYKGLIVIGRRKSYLENKAIINEVLSEIGYPVSILTYEDLVDSVDLILSRLEKAKGKD
jgi:hypothetical protein